MPIGAVLAVVAAAGRSGRMGAAKALLPFDGDTTFVGHIVDVCAAVGCSIVVTIPDDHGDAANVIAAVGTAITTTNPQPHLGISGSIFAAVDAAAIAFDAILLWPVDAPFADVADVRAVIAALADDDVDAAVPVVDDGRRGHPVVLRASLLPLIRAHADDGGPQRVLEQVRVVEVAVGDDRIALNMNTPADVRRAFHEP